MKYKGVEYSVVQLVDGTGWRWEVNFGDGKSKTGVTQASRTAAIKLAEHEIDRILVEKSKSVSVHRGICPPPNRHLRLAIL
jgi:hypothetical protein